MKKLLILTLLMLVVAVNAFALTYSPDGVAITKDEIHEVAVEPILGPIESQDDFPLGRPDGWVLKADSVYKSQAVLFADYKANKIKKPSGYTGAMLPTQLSYFKNHKWEKLSSYIKQYAHLELEKNFGVVGWDIDTIAVVETTQTEHIQWANALGEGFDEENMAEFFSDGAIYNSYFMRGCDNCGTHLTTGLTTKTLHIDQYTSSEDVKSRFINGLISSGFLPKSKVMPDGKGSIIYSK